MGLEGIRWRRSRFTLIVSYFLLSPSVDEYISSRTAGSASTAVAPRGEEIGVRWSIPPGIPSSRLVAARARTVNPV